MPMLPATIVSAWRRNRRNPSRAHYAIGFTNELDATNYGSHRIFVCRAVVIRNYGRSGGGFRGRDQRRPAHGSVQRGLGNPFQGRHGRDAIGNGDVATGVYALEEGDLYLLLAKNDAFNFNGDIYKIGRVRISLDPNPFKAGKPFRQVLDLPTGSI